MVKPYRIKTVNIYGIGGKTSKKLYWQPNNSGHFGDLYSGSII